MYVPYATIFKPMNFIHTVHLWVSYESQNKPDYFPKQPTPTGICNGVAMFSVRSELNF